MRPSCLREPRHSHNGTARLQQTISMEPEPQAYEPTVITVKATVDSMGIYLSYKERYKETAQIQKIETIIEKEVNVPKWWQKLFIWLGIAFCVILILWIAIRSLTLIGGANVVQFAKKKNATR